MAQARMAQASLESIARGASRIPEMSEQIASATEGQSQAGLRARPAGR